MVSISDVISRSIVFGEAGGGTKPDPGMPLA